MQCPVDGETLVMSHRNGIEIDYCPKCRGIWLDRGEMDKIVERALAEAAPPVSLREPGADRAAPRPAAADPRERPAARGSAHDGRRRDDGDRRHRDEDDDDDDRRYGDGRPPKRKKVSSFLDDLFDF